jgi:hypothetical protein
LLQLLYKKGIPSIHFIQAFEKCVAISFHPASIS